MGKNKGINWQNGSYHNHTTWSDGKFPPREIVEKAIALGFSAAGICDHYVTEKGDIKFVGDSQIEAYCAELNALKQEYAGKITVLSGLEIDTTRQNPNIGNLPFDLLNKLDFVLFEYANEWAENRQKNPALTLPDVIEIRKNLTCEVGLAHSKIVYIAGKYGPKQAAKMLAKNNIFIDVCGSERNSRNHTCVYAGCDKQQPYCRRGYELFIETVSQDFLKHARKQKVGFVPSSDTHYDEEMLLDNMSATRHAIAAIERNKLHAKEFSIQKI